VERCCVNYGNQIRLSFALNVVDITVCSLYLMGDSRQMNSLEREELKRRTLTMLLYLLRSPFYDRYSKSVLLHTIRSVIPLEITIL